VALCLRQSQTAGSNRPGGKGSGYKRHGVGQRNFSGKRRGKVRAPSQRGGRGGGSTGRAAGNGGGQKAAGLIRPMVGKNRF
jgi:hypothetical protein